MLGKQRKTRSNKGFTLIELLVVVIIIGILAAIALPNFIGVQNKARDASTKANMRTVQIAAESFATDNGGTYPTLASATGFVNYFPGGSSSMTGTAGNYPVNPYTNLATAISPITIAGTVAAERLTAGSMTGSAPGAIGYAPVASTVTGSTGITSYAIEGASSAGVALSGNAAGTTLVLSNQ